MIVRAAFLLLLCAYVSAAQADETFPAGTIGVFEGDYYPDYEGAAPPARTVRSLKRSFPAGFSIKGDDASYRDRWFRAEFDIDPGARTEPYAVYVPNVIQNIALYLDGRPIGVSAELERPSRLNWNIPQLFVVPEQMLTPGRHELHFRVYSGYWGTGRISPFAIGPARILIPVHERRQWVQFYGPQASSFAVAFIGILSVVLWLRRRSETAFGYFALVCLLWMIRNFHLVTRDPLLPAFAFYVVTHSSVLWLSAAIYIFSFRMLDQRLPRIELAWLIYACAGTLALILSDSNSFWQTARMVLGPPQLFGVVLVVYLGWQAWRRPRTSIVLLFIATLVTLLLGIYDALLWQGSLSFPRIYLMPYGALLFAAVAGWALVDRFVYAQTEFESLNRQLERRVRDKEAELAINYARLTELERERAVAVERQRIMRDIHDGLGSQLLTSISLVERGQMQSHQVAVLLRECVDDLRIAIDSLRPTGSDLLAVLGNLRYRLEPRLAAAGIALAWHVQDMPPLPQLNSENVLNIMRIVQEALTNTIKHARASTVHVTFDFDIKRGRHRLTVIDNGLGFDTSNGARGEGLRNMQLRGRKCGASVDVQSSQAGTSVTIHLPSVSAATVK